MEPADPNYLHVFPLEPAPDWAHPKPPNVIERPAAECWLCQQGICVQSLLERGLVVHGTWQGH